MPAGATVTVLSDGLLDLNGLTQTLATLNVQGGLVTTGASGSGQLTVGGLNMTGGTVTAATRRRLRHPRRQRDCCLHRYGDACHH